MKHDILTRQTTHRQTGKALTMTLKTTLRLTISGYLVVVTAALIVATKLEERRARQIAANAPEDPGIELCQVRIDVKAKRVLGHKPIGHAWRVTDTNKPHIIIRCGILEKGRLRRVDRVNLVP